MRGYHETDKSESVVLRLAQPDGTYVKVDVAEFVSNPDNDLYPAYLGAAREYRFSGQVSPGVYYSGAHHAIFVSAIVNMVLDGSKAAVLGGIIHDLPEAFIRDIPTPVKKVMHASGNWAYDALHSKLDDAFDQRFGLLLTPEDLEIIAKADTLALRAEQTAFQGVDHGETTDDDRRCLQLLAFIGVSTQEELEGAHKDGMPVHLAMAGLLADAVDVVVEQYQGSMPLN